jgi:hypothetical protein
MCAWPQARQQGGGQHDTSQALGERCCPRRALALPFSLPAAGIAAVRKGCVSRVCTMPRKGHANESWYDTIGQPRG